MFREGHSEGHELTPNNWESVFGGSAWTRVTEADSSPGEWYLHLFDESQPDFNWDNPDVWQLFRGVLRFWLDRGVDGFRVDVAHGLVKKTGLPDKEPVPNPPLGDDGPFWAPKRGGGESPRHAMTYLPQIPLRPGQGPKLSSEQASTHCSWLG